MVSIIETKTGRARSFEPQPGTTVWGLKRIVAEAFFQRNAVPPGTFDGRISVAARMTLEDRAVGRILRDDESVPAEGTLTMTVAPQQGGK